MVVELLANKVWKNHNFFDFFLPFGERVIGTETEENETSFNENYHGFFGCSSASIFLLEKIQIETHVWFFFTTLFFEFHFKYSIFLEFFQKMFHLAFFKKCFFLKHFLFFSNNYSCTVILKIIKYSCTKVLFCYLCVAHYM